MWKYSWQRGPNLPYLWKFRLYCLSPLIASNPPLLSPSTSTPATLSVVLFFWLNGWSRHIWCSILLNDVMDLHMSSLSILVPEGHWCMFYATRRQVYWGLTHNVVFAGTLIWYHTHTNTQHTQGPLDWDTHINIHLHHLLRSYGSYLYYNEWIIHWYQK